MNLPLSQCRSLLSDRSRSPRAERGLLPISSSPREWGENDELTKVNGIDLCLSQWSCLVGEPWKLRTFFASPKVIITGVPAPRKGWNTLFQNNLTKV